MLYFEKLLATISPAALRFSPLTHNSLLGAQLIALSKRTNRSGAPYLRTGPKGILNAHI
jgi:hypothetical protein